MIQNKRHLVLALALVFTMLIPASAGALPTLNRASIRLGRLGSAASTGNDMFVTFKLNTTPTSVAKISVFFPSGFNIASGTPTVDSTTFPLTPSGVTTPPGTLTAAATPTGGANSGGTIVVSGLTSASLNNTSLYGFTIPTGTITNPTTSGAQYNTTVSSQNSGGTALDTTTTPVYITGSSADQVVVSASVAPNFSFSLSGTTDTIPQADAGNIKESGGVTMNVGTNSPLGYTAYVKSSGKLHSTTANYDINTGAYDATPDSLTGSKYGFYPSTGTACTTCIGAPVYDAEYNIADGTHAGSFNSTNFASFVSHASYTNSDLIILKERLIVANTVPYANDYTDTLTIVAAGNY